MNGLVDAAQAIFIVSFIAELYRMCSIYFITVKIIYFKTS